MATTRRYLTPRTLEEATAAAAGKGVALLAGGTDLLPRFSRGWIDRPETLVSLSRIGDLKGIARANGEIRIGACTPLNELAQDPMLRDVAPVLAQAAERVACPQIRNRATIGGNLCNASPAADTAIPLLLLDAVLELVSSKEDGTQARDVPISDFFQGPGNTVLAPGEILKDIRFEQPPRGIFTAWDKFGTRPAMEIAVASVGVALMLAEGVVMHARIGYGSVAPIPMRGKRAEGSLLGNVLSDEIIHECETAARLEIVPITDVRGSEEYRREVVGVMLRRMLEDARHE
jgi:CO/xanthine dehydrogenase FAD-binding subunit